MNKGKFASLIMLGAFSAGVASSSAVSAQGDENLASVVDNKSASSHDDSVSIDPKVSNEPMFAADETNIDTETTTDEETQDDSIDDNSDAGVNAKNIDDNPENKTDLPENLDKEDKEDTDYMFVGDEKQNVKKGNGVETVKGFAIAGIGVSAVSGATLGISKLVKTSGNEKKDEPSPETNPESDKPTSSEEEEKEPDKKDKPKPEPKPEPNKKEEKGDFGEWYKNNLGVSIPLTLLSVCIFYIIFLIIKWGIEKRLIKRRNIVMINSNGSLGDQIF